MKTVHVEVTAQDIAKGRKFGCTTCPVALAVARVTGGQCYVGGGYLDVFGVYEVIEHTDRVAAFIEQFDGGEPVQPFEFDLTIPDNPPPLGYDE